MTKAAVARDQSAEYAWAFPGIPVRIHIHLTVIAQLRGILQEKHTAAEHRREMGGLLLGRRRADGIEINGFQLLESPGNDRYFTLSAAQQAKLRTSMHISGRDVIGYFRSDLRGGIQLAEQDLVIIREFFHDPNNVFLVIRTEDDGPLSAGFFFWDNGSIFADASFMQFPFDERVLPASTAKEPPQPERIPSPRTDPVAIAPPVQANRSKHSTSKRQYQIAIAALVLVAIACSLAAYTALKAKSQNAITIARPAATMASPLSVSASRLGKELVITWDSQALATVNARVGILTIKDGQSQVEVPLTKSQLHDSKLVYANRSDVVEVTLEVFPLQGTPMRDSIIVALADAKVPSTSAPPVVSPNTQGVRVPAVAEAPVRTNTKLVIPFSPERSTPRQSPVIIEAPPPPIVDRLNSARLNAPEFLGSTAPSISHAAPLTVTKSPEPTPPASPDVTVRPPEIVRQIRPSIPSNILAMVKRQVEVQVRVSIDKDGKLIRSELLTPMRGVPDYIGAAIVNSIRYWTFRPARKGEVPVDSELTIRFTFGQ